MSEAHTDAGSETPQNAGDTSQQADIRSELSELKSTLSQLVGALTPKPKEPEPVDIEKTLKENPAKALELVVKKTVRESLEPVKQEFANENKKAEFDRRAEQQFPQMRSDPEFQKALKSQMIELMNTGEFTKDSPSLVYRAAQIASLSYKPKGGQGTGGMTSEEPSSVAAGRSSGPKFDANFDKMAKMFGIKNVDKLKEKITAKEGGRR